MISKNKKYIYLNYKRNTIVFIKTYFPDNNLIISQYKRKFCIKQYKSQIVNKKFKKGFYNTDLIFLSHSINDQQVYIYIYINI